MPRSPWLLTRRAIASRLRKIPAADVEPGDGGHPGVLDVVVKAEPLDRPVFHWPVCKARPVMSARRVLPTMFLIGPDGKVVNRNIQIATVEEEIKKLVK